MFKPEANCPPATCDNLFNVVPKASETVVKAVWLLLYCDSSVCSALVLSVDVSIKG